MNNNLKVVLSIAIVIAIGGSYMFPRVQRVVQDLGSNPGPSFLNFLEFDGGVQYGNQLSTTTEASMTLSVGDVKGYDTIIMRPTGAASTKTITFFASSTAAHWLPKAGDTQRTCWLNATTTAGATITFAAGTGIDLQSATSSPDLILNADNTACFTFVRKAQVHGVTNSFDIEASYVEFIDAD